MLFMNTACVDGNATVADASRVMRQLNVDEVVVTEARQGAPEPIPVGVLSARDVVDRVVALDLDASVVTAADVVSLARPQP
jgi:CBS domain-containing protein